MSGPDRPHDQESWQPPAAEDGTSVPPGSGAVPDGPGTTEPATATDGDATQVVSAEDLRRASDAPLPPAPLSAAPLSAATAEPPSATEPDAGGPSGYWATASSTDQPGSTAAPRGDTEPVTGPQQAAADRPADQPSQYGDRPPEQPGQYGQPSPTSVYAPNQPSGGDPDATSVYQVPATPTEAGRPASAAATGYAAGYAAGHYGPSDPELPRPYETPAYAPTSAPTPTPYSYQEQGYGYPPAQPMAEPPQALAPARTRVVIPKTPSRAGANVLAAVIGLLLTLGGLALLVLVPLPNDSLTEVANKILVIVVVVIMMVPALLLAWGAAATFLPGLIFTAASLWLLIGGQYAVDETHDALGTSGWVDRLIVFFGSVQGLAVGLALLFASIAAMMVRRYTRRAVQDAFDAEYAAEQMRPVLRP